MIFWKLKLYLGRGSSRWMVFFLSSKPVWTDAEVPKQAVSLKMYGSLDMSKIKIPLSQDGLEWVNGTDGV